MVAFTLISVDDPVAGRLIDRWAAPDDHSQAAKRPERGRASSLLARACLRALLHGHALHEDWTIHADSRGKLFVRSRGQAGPSVCVSHSRGLVACAFAPSGALGIDVEVHRPRAYSAIAEFAFGPGERTRMGLDGADAFYRIWTLREAMAKATGDGLALATDGRDRAADGPDEGRWVARNDGGRWLFMHSRPQPGVSLAIAVLVPTDADGAAEPLQGIAADTLL
jgi:4'-phosphopantetheinyl transferase